VCLDLPAKCADVPPAGAPGGPPPLRLEGLLAAYFRSRTRELKCDSGTCRSRAVVASYAITAMPRRQCPCLLPPRGM
jgi:hypothetical protein